MNRGNVTATDFKKFVIDLENNDAVPIMFLRNEIKPEIIDNQGQLKQVPIEYVNGERWAQVKKTGYLYDGSEANGDLKLKIPVIAIARPSVAVNKSLSRKPNIKNPFTTAIVRQYDKNNRYDNFSRLRGEQPVWQMENIVIPTYVDLSYEIGIWAEFSVQMNQIIQPILYAEGTYWNYDGYYFYVWFDNLNTDVSVQGDSQRTVRATVSLNMTGYIIPDTVAREKYVKTQGNTIRRVVMSERIQE